MNERIPNMSDDFGTVLAEREVVEVPLLLPGWQVEALASAARDRGLTTGAMMRRLLRDFIVGLDDRRTSTIP